MNHLHQGSHYKEAQLDTRNLGRSDQRMLGILHEMLSAYTAKHNRTLIVRLNINCPKEGNPSIPDGWTLPNCAWSNFLNTLIRTLKRKGLDPKYFWCKEHNLEPDKNGYVAKWPHWHLCLFLDGNKGIGCFNEELLGKANGYWVSALGIDWTPLIHQSEFDSQRHATRKRDGFIVNTSPTYQAELQQVFTSISYLAKQGTKENLGRFSNSFDYSRNFINELRQTSQQLGTDRLKTTMDSSKITQG